MGHKPPQPELPFSMEGRVAGREIIRSSSKNSGDLLRKMDLSNIRIRPGFNARRQRGLPEDVWELTLGIADLADKIYASCGPADPLIGDITKDGVFYQTEGERRIRALNHLVHTGRTVYPNGQPVSSVLVLLNPPGTTDMERKRKILTTNDKLTLRPMDRAYLYLSFKIEDKMTHEDIAASLGVSRQTVDNYIKATELPTQTQDDIDAEKINISAALSEYRKSQADLKKSSVVDTDTGEIVPKEEKPVKDKDGDEDEFLDKQDNSISSGGTKGGPAESGSGAVVIGQDSIYRQKQIEALWKQLVNRYEVIKEEILLGATLENGAILNWQDKVAERLRNEYNITVK